MRETVTPLSQFRTTLGQFRPLAIVALWLSMAVAVMAVVTFTAVLDLTLKFPQSSALPTLWMGLATLAAFYGLFLFWRRALRKSLTNSVILGFLRQQTPRMPLLFALEDFEQLSQRDGSYMYAKCAATLLPLAILYVFNPLLAGITLAAAFFMTVIAYDLELRERGKTGENLVYEDLARHLLSSPEMGARYLDATLYNLLASRNEQQTALSRHALLARSFMGAAILVTAYLSFRLMDLSVNRDLFDLFAASLTIGQAMAAGALAYLVLSPFADLAASVFYAGRLGKRLAILNDGQGHHAATLQAVQATEPEKAAA